MSRAYIPNADRPDSIDRPLKSNPDFRVWGPGTLKWGIRNRIAQQSDSLAAMLDILIKGWLLHPNSGWDLIGREGRPIDRTAAYIDDGMDPEDVGDIALWLGQTFYPEIFGEVGEPDATDEDPAGNAGAPASPEPAETSGEPRETKSAPKTRNGAKRA